HRLAQVEWFPFFDEDRIDERRSMPELEGIEHACPRLRLERRKKTAGAGGRRAVRHTLERLDLIPGDQTADLARGRRHRRARCAFGALRQRPREPSVDQEPSRRGGTRADERSTIHYRLPGRLLYQWV